MDRLTPPSSEVSALTFSRLLATLGIGVGAVTLILWLAGGHLVADVICALLVVLVFSAVVVREANRLLCDE